MFHYTRFAITGASAAW